MLQNGGGVTAAAPDGLIKDTTTQTFVKDVIEESKHQPVLIDFWAPWCGPCKQLTPVLEKVVKAAKGKVKLVKMNIDDHPAIPGQMGIQSIPAVIAFVNGQPADGFMGAIPESQVVAFLERLTKGAVGGEEKDLLKAADEALAQKDFAAAADIYGQLLTEDPANVPALAGLARAYVANGAIEQAKQTLAMVPEAKRNDAAVAAARAAIELAEQSQSVGPIGELEQKVAANPGGLSGAVRSGAGAERRRQAPGSGRSAHRDRQARPQMERRRRDASSSFSSSRPGVRPTRPASAAASGCLRSCLRSARSRKIADFRTRSCAKLREIRGATGSARHRLVRQVFGGQDRPCR